MKAQRREVFNHFLFVPISTKRFGADMPLEGREGREGEGREGTEGAGTNLRGRAAECPPSGSSYNQRGRTSGKPTRIT